MSDDVENTCGDFTNTTKESCETACATVSFTGPDQKMTTEHSCSTAVPIAALVGEDVCQGKGEECFKHDDMEEEGIKLTDVNICCCAGELYDHIFIFNHFLHTCFMFRCNKSNQGNVAPSLRMSLEVTFALVMAWVIFK